MQKIEDRAYGFALTAVYYDLVRICQALRVFAVMAARMTEGLREKQDVVRMWKVRKTLQN